MAKQIVVIGPPGTGKTTAMTRFTEQWFNRGIDSREIAYLAYTKAASIEAAERIIGSKEEGGEELANRFPYFRTIHSLAYRGLTREFPDMRLVTTADMKRFAEWSSFEGTFIFDKWEDMAAVFQKLQSGGKTMWDSCLLAYTMSRISARNAADLERYKLQPTNRALDLVGYLQEDVYQAFVEKYEAYKNQNGLVDFTDMLAYALTKMSPVSGVRQVVIDEAQDLSPITVAICDRLFENAEACYWAGDEDQAIFDFSGADARLFIERYRKSIKIHLEQTHRFGQEVWDFADQIIRKVTERIPKTVYGVKGRKHEISIQGQFEPFVSKALILHRLTAGCQHLASIYRAEGLPFRNERGDDPLGSYNRVEAFRTLNALANGEAVSGSDVTEFILKFVPSYVTDTNGRHWLVTRGAMKKLKGEALAGKVNLRDLQAANILSSEGAEAISNRYYEVFGHSEDFDYYQRVLDHGYKLMGDNMPTITTLHGSKGRQAEKVVVFSELSSKCLENQDAEHRLAFVGATRTSGTLQICAEQTIEWASQKYDYPDPKNLDGVASRG